MSIWELWVAIWPELLVALWATIRLAAGALTLGLVVGLFIALLRLNGGPRIARASEAYVELLRGTPALVQLFIVYFGLATIGIRLSAYQAAVLGLGLNASAYLSEVYRAGIQSVSAGQMDAAEAIGMNYSTAMRWIILPQAIRVVLGPIGNISVSLLKDTSVASLISAPDLMLRAQDISAEYFMPLPIYIMVGCIYFAMCYPLSLAVRWQEARMNGHVTKERA